MTQCHARDTRWHKPSNTPGHNQSTSATASPVPSTEGKLTPLRSGQSDRFNSSFHLLRAPVSSGKTSSAPSLCQLKHYHAAFLQLQKSPPWKPRPSSPPSSVQLSLVSSNFVLFHVGIHVQAPLFLSGSCSIFTTAHSCVSTGTPCRASNKPSCSYYPVPVLCHAMISVPPCPHGEAACAAFSARLLQPRDTAQSKQGSLPPGK